MKQPFIGKVENEDRAKLKKVVELNPIADELFGRKWIEDNILTHTDVYTIHPLFFRALNDFTFSTKLEFLKQKHAK